MTQMGKHVSIDEPPGGRFFSSKVNSDNAPGNSVMSRAKRVSLHTEYIEQLQKWHKFMESGAITKSLYNELQCKLFDELVD